MQRTALIAALVLSPVAAADTIFASGNPFGWPQGPTGAEVYTSQSAAIRFTPTTDATLSRLSLWLMSTAPAGIECSPTVTVSLRADNGESTPAPGAQPIESWTRGISASGPSPVL